MLSNRRSMAWTRGMSDLRAKGKVARADDVQIPEGNRIFREYSGRIACGKTVLERHPINPTGQFLHNPKGFAFLKASTSPKGSFGQSMTGFLS